MTTTDLIARTQDDALGVRRAYGDRGWTALPDAQLVAEVGRVLAMPREQPADSFVLHAPLELAARAALLPFVLPGRREDARLRLASLAVGFEASGPPVRSLAPPVGESEPADLAIRLVDAMNAGELDDVDVLAGVLGRTASPATLVRLLGDDVVVRLAAAAHTPIFLYQLPRVAPRGEVTGELLRGVARELARYPDWRLTWVDDRPPTAGARPEELFDAVAGAPFTGPPDSTFIYPLMSSVDRSGLAAAALQPVTGGPVDDERAAALTRAAAWSMLLEPDDHAPYGWSHCLTMPQAALGIADSLRDPSLALAVAATYVVGFRSALALRPLVPHELPRPATATFEESLDAGRAEAAGWAWHATDEQLPSLVTALATNAATAHDAHLVKHTLACLDAAHADPTDRRLYLAAAASLAAWWRRHGDPSDPLAT